MLKVELRDCFGASRFLKERKNSDVSLKEFCVLKIGQLKVIKLRVSYFRKHNFSGLFVGGYQPQKSQNFWSILIPICSHFFIR